MHDRRRPSGRRLAGLLAVAALFGGLTGTFHAREVTLDDDEDRTLYALGLVLAQQLANLELSAEELERVEAGLREGVRGAEPRVELETWGPTIEPLVISRTARRVDRLREVGRAYRERAAEADGAVTTETGLVFVEQQPGDGVTPGETEIVRVHYESKLIDDSLVDSSRRAGEPAVFRIDQAPACIGEGLRRMAVGGRARLVCPPELAYGDRGFPPRIPPAATLVFDLELLGIEAPEAPAAAETADEGQPAPTVPAP